MNLEETIQACINAKDGNKELAIFFIRPDWWHAEIGNPSSHVMLGESEGEFRGEGDTALEALQNLLKELTK